MTKMAAEVAVMSGKCWPSYLAAKAVGKNVPNNTTEKAKKQIPWYSSTLTKKLEFEIPSDTQALASEQNNNNI